MRTKIRLSRVGAKNQPRWRVVVQDKSVKRDGKVIETLGLYHPKKENSEIKINQERYQFWVNRGAEVSSVVKKLLS